MNCFTFTRPNNFFGLFGITLVAECIGIRWIRSRSSWCSEVGQCSLEILSVNFSRNFCVSWNFFRDLCFVLYTLLCFVGYAKLNNWCYRMFLIYFSFFCVIIRFL